MVKKKTAKQKLGYALFLIICFLLLSELSLWILGYRPFTYQPYKITSDPKMCLLPNKIYGFSLNPGTYKVTINDHHTYTSTHNEDSLRITSYEPIDSATLSLHIYGCSYTYGFGVDDSLSYPFLLQQTLKDVRVINHAVPAYGTLQALMQLKKHEKNAALPNILVINYASFHNDRNVLSPTYRRNLWMGFAAANEGNKQKYIDCKFPYAVLEDDKTVVKHEAWDAIDNNWPLRTYSAFVNFLQTTIENNSFPEESNLLVTKRIMEEISMLCKENNIKLIVTGITKDVATSEMLLYCTTLGAKTVEMGIDLKDKKYHNAPYDTHPNSLAHKIFSEKVKMLLIPHL